MPAASNGCSIVGGDTPLEARFFSGRSRRHVRRATSARLVVHARDLSATEEKHLGTEVRERERERDESLVMAVYGLVDVMWTLCGSVADYRIITGALEGLSISLSLYLFLFFQVCAGSGVPGPVSLSLSVWNWCHQSVAGDRLRHLCPHHSMFPQLRSPGTHVRRPFCHQKEVIPQLRVFIGWYVYMCVQLSAFALLVLGWFGREMYERQHS